MYKLLARYELHTGTSHSKKMGCRTFRRLAREMSTALEKL
jgi:hypothetical protein